MPTNTKRIAGIVTTSILLFVVTCLALLWLYTSFGWPLWQGVILAIVVGLIAGGANFLFARRAR